MREASYYPHSSDLRLNFFGSRESFNPEKRHGFGAIRNVDFVKELLKHEPCTPGVEPGWA